MLSKRNKGKIKKIQTRHKHNNLKNPKKPPTTKNKQKQKSNLRKIERQRYNSYIYTLFVHNICVKQLIFYALSILSVFKIIMHIMHRSARSYELLIL